MEALSNIIPLSIFVIVLISYHIVQGNPVIITGPHDRFPRALESSTIHLDCQVNETVDISLVAWSKTFLESTELIYTYDGNEGQIIPAPPADLPWKYRVLESQEQDRNFTLEIGNITLSDVGTYECTVESNGQNYTEQANVSVYGSPKITQVQDFVFERQPYSFCCSVDIAVVDNSSEVIMAVLPSIHAWYRLDLSSDPVDPLRLTEEWTGLEPFGEVLPVYTEEFWVSNQDADYDNPHFLGCNFSTAELEVFDVSQRTHIGVPVKDVKLTPAGDQFEPGDEIYCEAFGYPPVSRYAWTFYGEPHVKIIDGQVLAWNDSDVGAQLWRCTAWNYMNGEEYYRYEEKVFTVVPMVTNPMVNKPVTMAVTKATTMILDMVLATQTTETITATRERAMPLQEMSMTNLPPAMVIMATSMVATVLLDMEAATEASTDLTKLEFQKISSCEKSSSLKDCRVDIPCFG